MAKVLLSLPDDLLKDFDEFCETYRYERSELLRSLIRTRVYGASEEPKKIPPVGYEVSGPVTKTETVVKSTVEKPKKVRAEGIGEVKLTGKFDVNDYCPCGSYWRSCKKHMFSKGKW